MTYSDIIGLLAGLKIGMPYPFSGCINPKVATKTLNVLLADAKINRSAVAVSTFIELGNDIVLLDALQ